MLAGVMTAPFSMVIGVAAASDVVAFCDRAEVNLPVAPETDVFPLSANTVLMPANDIVAVTVTASRIVNSFLFIDVSPFDC